MRRFVACIGIALASLWIGPAAGASCAEESEEDRFARAELVFEGVAGGAGDPHDDGADAGTASTARFTVDVYEKGTGPETVEVLTGERTDGDTVSMVSNGLTVTEGDRWRIYRRWESDGLVATSACDGSQLIVRGITSHAPAPEEEVYTTMGLPGDDAPVDTSGRGWFLPAMALLAVSGSASAAGLLLRRGR